MMHLKSVENSSERLWSGLVFIALPIGSPDGVSRLGVGHAFKRDGVCGRLAMPAITRIISARACDRCSVHPMSNEDVLRLIWRGGRSSQHPQIAGMPRASRPSPAMIDSLAQSDACLELGKGSEQDPQSSTCTVYAPRTDRTSQLAPVTPEAPAAPVPSPRPGFPLGYCGVPLGSGETASSPAAARNGDIAQRSGRAGGGDPGASPPRRQLGKQIR